MIPARTAGADAVAEMGIFHQGANVDMKHRSLSLLIDARNGANVFYNTGEHSYLPQYFYIFATAAQTRVVATDFLLAHKGRDGGHAATVKIPAAIHFLKGADFMMLFGDVFVGVVCHKFDDPFVIVGAASLFEDLQPCPGTRVNPFFGAGAVTEPAVSGCMVSYR